MPKEEKIIIIYSYTNGYSKNNINSNWICPFCETYDNIIDNYLDYSYCNNCYCWFDSIKIKNINKNHDVHNMLNKTGIIIYSDELYNKYKKRIENSTNNFTPFGKMDLYKSL
jgi:hypothetical protein